MGRFNYERSFDTYFKELKTKAEKASKELKPDIEKFGLVLNAIKNRMIARRCDCDFLFCFNEDRCKNCQFINELEKIIEHKS